MGGRGETSNIIVLAGSNDRAWADMAQMLGNTINRDLNDKRNEEEMRRKGREDERQREVAKD